MRKLLQPFFTFVRWVICHCGWGRRFTAWYKKRRDDRRTAKARARLQRLGAAALGEIHEILSSEGIPYYLEYGSMLGAVREGHFILHDDDLDFGLPPDAVDAKKLCRHLITRGLSFDKAFAWRGFITEMSFFLRGIPVDFFLTFNIAGKVQGFSFDKFVSRDGRNVALVVKHLWKPDYAGVHDIDFMGVKTSMLNRAEESLTRTYGDWRTPVHNFKGKDKDAYRISVEDEADIILGLEEFLNYPERPASEIEEIIDDWFVDGM